MLVVGKLAVADPPSAERRRKATLEDAQFHKTDFPSHACSLQTIHVTPKIQHP